MRLTDSLRRLSELEGARRHLAASVACLVCVALVTGAVAAIETFVPVLSAGVLYVFAVLPIAVLFGLGYAVAESILSMLAFNFFFLDPRHTLTLADSSNWFALAVYVATALVVSELAARSRRRASEAEQRERETRVLAEISTELLLGADLEAELDGIGARVAGVLGIPRARIELGPQRDPPMGEAPLELEAGARRVGTLYVSGGEPSLAVRRRFLPALASLLAVALDRERFAREAVETAALRRSDTIKTAVLRAVSHDLRSPLTAIRVASEGLVNAGLDLEPADRKELVETIRIEVNRLDRLVANLLDLSRLQAGAAAPSPELWTADDLIAQALDELGEDADRVQVELPADFPPMRVDAGQMQRVLVNLLDNALKFSSPGDPVTVRGTRTRNEAIIRVVDRGPGLPQEQLEHVFEPFHNVPGGDGRRGAGLGLAIARGFAEANGGRVWAESRPGQGASFALAVPLPEEAPAG